MKFLCAGAGFAYAGAGSACASWTAYDRPILKPCCSIPHACSEEIFPGSSPCTAELVSAVPSFAHRADKDAGALDAEGLQCVFKNLDDGNMFVVDEVGTNGSFRRLRERLSNRTVTTAKFERISGLSPFIRDLMRRWIWPLE